jgi:ChrR-like protein with cupin domain
MTPTTQRLAPLEAVPVDLEHGWQRLAGFPEGIEVKMLADDLDEALACGARTRLVRVAAGVRTQEVLMHPYWEEVFLLSGDFTHVDEAAQRTVQGPSYSRRPPGTRHGPFVTSGGCMLLEVQYFAP